MCVLCVCSDIILIVRFEQEIKTNQSSVSNTLKKLNQSIGKAYHYATIKDKYVELNCDKTEGNMSFVVVSVRADAPKCPHCTKPVLRLQVCRCAPLYVCVLM